MRITFERNFNGSQLNEEYLSKMKQANKLGDIEVRHSQVDDILCELLAVLGFGEVVEEWGKEGKWYA